MKNTNPIYLKAVMLLFIFLNPTSVGMEVNKRPLQQEGADFTSINEPPINAKGVLDRFEDNDTAVILMEELNEEIIVPQQFLPEGSGINMWFDLELNEERIVAISVDWWTTWNERERTQELMEKLRK